MKPETIFIDFNEVSAMHLKPGDKVICRRSTVEGREGRIFTAINDPMVSKKRMAEGNAPIWWLQHCSSYGDRFERYFEDSETSCSFGKHKSQI